LVFKLGANYGECFHQSWDILLGSDSSGVKDERRLNRIALQNLLILAGVGFLREARIGRAVDGSDAAGGNAHEALYVTPGGMGNGDDAFSTRRATAITFLVHCAPNIAASRIEQA